MSRLELDDQILEHPKFIRAVRIGGSETVHLWLGLRAYCGQKLSDGFVPEDMLDDVRGPSNAKRRANALEALLTVGLLERLDGGVQLHDFLDHARSRAQVLADRSRARERQALSRCMSRRDIERSHSVSHDAPDQVSSARVTMASGSSSGSSSASAPKAQEAAENLTSGRARGPEEQRQRDNFVSCPRDLALTEDQIATLETGGIQRAAIAPLTLKFVAKHVGNPDDRRTLAVWRKGLSSAVVGDWNAGWRPKAPGEQEHEQRKADEDQEFMRRVRRGEYGERVRAMSLHGEPVAKLRVAVRERAQRQKVVPPEREQHTETPPEPVAVAPPAAPPAPPGVVDLGTIEDTVSTDDTENYAPLVQRAERPTPAAAAGQAGPVNLGGFAASLIAERAAERARKKAQGIE